MNYIDPSGKFFTMMDFGMANSIRSIVNSIQIEFGTKFMDGLEAGVDQATIDMMHSAAFTGVVPIAGVVLKNVNKFAAVGLKQMLGKLGVEFLGNAKPRYVYRAIRRDELQMIKNGMGIKAKAPQGKWNIFDHIIKGSRNEAALHDPFISTTDNLDVAKDFLSEGHRGALVRIDLNKIQGGEIRSWELTPKTSFESTAIKLSGKEREISIRGHIPNDAINIMEELQ